MKAFVMEASVRRFTILNRFVFFRFRKIKNYNTYYFSLKCWPKPASSADIIMVFHNPNLFKSANDICIFGPNIYNSSTTVTQLQAPLQASLCGLSAHQVFTRCFCDI